jgi:hypothetical protein
MNKRAKVEIGSRVKGLLDTPVVTGPESAVLFGAGSSIPFYGPGPGISAALGAVGMSRLAKHAPGVRRLLGENPITPAVIGGLGGLGLGSYLFGSPEEGALTMRAVSRPIL